MEDIYQSISEPSEGIYREKGSKFIGLAYPIVSEDQVKEIIEGLRNDHPGACHFCYAYRIGPDGKNFRANDDGEPAGSAGKPILNQLLSFGYSDLLVVVVRYYGGTKLGVSGLIGAYKESAKEALMLAQAFDKTVSSLIVLEFPFNLQGEVEKLMKEFRAVLVNKSFDRGCLFEIEVPKSKITSFTERAGQIRNLEVRMR